MAHLESIAEEPEEIQLKEELYIGNLHHIVGRGQHNNNCWTMFISTSPTDVVPPSTIKKVTYHLHETFRPNRVVVKDPPFYLRRIGWGYFEVRADIILKSELYGSNNRISTSHSIHFGSPLITHHIQTALPYVVNASSLQDSVTKQSELRRLKQTQRDVDKQNADQYDCVTKQYIEEIVLSGFCLTPQTMKETLTEHMCATTPKEVIAIIVAYACLYSIGADNKHSAAELSKTRIVLKNCYSAQFFTYCPVLELVLMSCGGCEIQYSDIKRTVRVYNSAYINLYNKGMCSSYRFEKCKNINVEALDVRQQVIFMSLFSEALSFKMFNAYFPNDSSKCVDQFPVLRTLDYDNETDEKQLTDIDKVIGNNDNDVDVTQKGGVIDGWKKWFIEGSEECYLTIFRKDTDVALFGPKASFSYSRGASLIPFI